jgi:hypothetical protein
VRGSATLLAGGENTWRLMDGNMLGEVSRRSVDLCNSSTVVNAVECKSGLHLAQSSTLRRAYYAAGSHFSVPSFT